jgi:predicted glycoside hydrolase/deacetylase ChbG (UPF0249 family)
MRRLIVNADDFGMCRGSVDGILHGHRSGIITSTSFMAGMPAAARAAEAARGCPGLDVGVHLTFTEGLPVLPAADVASLLDARGRFLTSREWLASHRQPDPVELEREFRAQIERCRASGLEPSHLDLHTSIGYLLEGVFALTVKLAAEQGLAIRFPFGEGWEGMGHAAAAVTGLPLERIQEMVDGCRKLVAAAAVPHPDRMIDAFPNPSARSGESLARLITGLGEGTSEILTHPAFLRGSLKALGIEAAKRAAELAALCSPRARQALQDGGIELVSFRSLIRRGESRVHDAPGRSR